MGECGDRLKIIALQLAFLFYSASSWAATSCSLVWSGPFDAQVGEGGTLTILADEPNLVIRWIGKDYPRDTTRAVKNIEEKGGKLRTLKFSNEQAGMYMERSALLYHVGENEPVCQTNTININIALEDGSRNYKQPGGTYNSSWNKGNDCKLVWRGSRATRAGDSGVFEITNAPKEMQVVWRGSNQEVIEGESGYELSTTAGEDDHMLTRSAELFDKEGNFICQTNSAQAKVIHSDNSQEVKSSRMPASIKSIQVN